MSCAMDRAVLDEQLACEPQDWKTVLARVTYVFISRFYDLGGHRLFWAFERALGMVACYISIGACSGPIH